MLGLIFKLIFAVLLIQIVAGAARIFRRPTRRRKRPERAPEQDRDYKHLTPHEIEDAEYEDLKE